MEKWEDPAVRSENLMPAHAVFPEETLSLGGKWRFLGLQSLEEVPTGWTGPDFAERKWSRIIVPGSWETEDIPNSGSITVGLYRKSFILSREQGRRQIILRFEAVPNETALWINGTYIGKASGMGMPVEFDITGAVRPEKNAVCLMVHRGADTTGLPGDVALYSLPARAITQLSAETRWQQDGTPLLRLGVSVRDAEGFTLRIALMDSSRVLHYQECPVENGGAEALIPCGEVKVWSPEQPMLYRIAVILWDGVAIYHTRELTVGFRRVSRQNDGTVLINGLPEKLFAAEYSAIDPDSGCFLSRNEMESRLSVLKSHRINSVVLNSPAPDSFYGLCDSLGLYVLDCSAARDKRHGDVFGSHPSILAWNVSPEMPGILNMDRLVTATETGSGTCSPQTVLLSLPHSADGLDQLIPQLHSTPNLLGAVFGSSALNGESALRELAALLQPIAFSYQDSTVTAANLSRSHSTEGYLCRSILTRDGEIQVIRELDLPLAPGETRTLYLETRYDIFKPGRYHLTVEYIHPKTGAVLASHQWEVGHLPHIFDEGPGGTIREDRGSLLLRSGDATFTVSRSTGFLEQLQFRDRPILYSSAWNVYAAAQEKSSGFHRADEWEKLTSGRRKLKPSVLEVDHMTRTVSASYKLGSGLIQSFRLFSDGSVSWELRLRTGKTAPACLGVCIPLDQKLDLLRWFGLGPDDADPEHRAGCFFGTHSQQGPSSGYKEPVYRASVTDSSGFGLAVRSEEGLRVSLQQADGCNHLRLELPVQELKPHTTYTFSFTLQPVQG